MATLEDAIARRVPSPPAGIVAARLRDGDIELAAAGPVTEDAVFELGSITKAVTGLLLADAVVRGEVALDTPLGDCLPGARALALGDLASHTAGLPRLPLAFLRRRGFFDLADPYAGTTVRSCSPISHGSGSGGRGCATRTSARRCSGRRSRRGPASGTRSWPRSGCCGRSASRAYGRAPRRRSPSRTTAAAGLSRRGTSAPTPPRAAYAGPLAAPWRWRRPACGRPSRWPPPSRWPSGRGAAAGRCAPGSAGCARRSPAAPTSGGTTAGTHGSRAFAGFVPATGAAIAVLTNSPKAPDGLARRLLADQAYAGAPLDSAIAAISSEARSNSSSESTGVPSNGRSRVISSHERHPP